MKVLKKLTAVALVVATVISSVVVSPKMEVKAYDFFEVSPETSSTGEGSSSTVSDNLGSTLKKSYTFDIDKTKVGVLESNIRRIGNYEWKYKKGNSTKKPISVTLKCSAKSKSDGLKKMKAFYKKFKASSGNKYGILRFKESSFSYNKSKKIATMDINCIDYVGFEKYMDLLMRGVRQGHKELTTVFNASTFKNGKYGLSDSAKCGLVMSMLGNFASYATSTTDGLVTYDWTKLIDKGGLKLNCMGYTSLAELIVESISHDTKIEEVGISEQNHMISVMQIKNSKGKYDYYLQSGPNVGDGAGCYEDMTVYGAYTSIYEIIPKKYVKSDITKNFVKSVNNNVATDWNAWVYKYDRIN